MEGGQILIAKDGVNGIGKRGRCSLDSSASCTSDIVVGAAHSVVSSSSLSDIASVSSVSSSVWSTRDTATSRMRFELRHGNHLHDNEVEEYVTPMQRKDRELKSLRREKSKLLRESEEKDSQIVSLKTSLETLRGEVEGEKDREITEYVEKIKVFERERFEQMEEVCRVQDELSKLDVRFIELKKEMSAKEETYEENLQRMFKKGQEAAKFEREEELEMLASSQKAPVSVRELTRKLSRTEQELAKWQGLRRQESYSQPDQLDTQAEATLSFLKDAFFHFLTDRSGSEDHLRAMITIFKFSEVQMDKIRRGLGEFKRLDRKRMSLK